MGDQPSTSSNLLWHDTPSRTCQFSLTSLYTNKVKSFSLENFLMFGYNQAPELSIINGSDSTLQMSKGGIQIGKKSGSAFKWGR